MYNILLLVNNAYTYSSLFIAIVIFLNLVYIKKCDRGKALTMQALLCVCLLTLVTPIVALTLCLFWSTRQLFGIILKIIYGRRFIGFFSNVDAVHGRSVVGKCAVNILLIAECDNETTEEDIVKNVTKTIKNVVVSSKKESGKLFSTLRHFLGYRFLLKKTNVDVTECVSKMKSIANVNVLTKPDLMDLLAYYTQHPFPFDNEFLWDVHVGVQPLQWKTVPNKKYYPILFRFHHSVADGVNVFNFVTGVCGRPMDNDDIISVKKEPNFLVWWCKFITETILCYFLFPAIIYISLVIRNNNLHLNIANNRKKGGTVTFQVEEIKTYFKKIIKISKSCGVSFTGVLAAAFSASINDYYMSLYDSAPEYLTTMIPLHPGSLDLKKLQPGSKKLNDVNLCNEYQILFVQLPIQPQDVPCYNKTSMIDRLGLVMQNINVEQQLSILRKAVNQFMKIHFTVSPGPILKLSTYFMEYGPIISNVPGTPKMYLGEGFLPISDYIFFVPDMKRFSFVLTVTTYDNRLHMAVGTSLDIKRKELQKLISNTHKYIDLLEKEIDSLSKSSKDSMELN